MKEKGKGKEEEEESRLRRRRVCGGEDLEMENIHD